MNVNQVIDIVSQSGDCVLLRLATSLGLSWQEAQHAWSLEVAHVLELSQSWHRQLPSCRQGDRAEAGVGSWVGELGGGGGHSWEGVGGVAQLGVGGGRHDQQVPQRPGQALALGQVDRQHDLLGLRLLALHHLVVDLMEVDLTNSLHRVLYGEGHKAKSSRFVRAFIL